MVKNTEVFKCFIITPIGNDRSEIRDSLDGLMQNAIVPVLNGLGFEEKNIFVAHHIHESGSINNQIINHIVEDDLNIVNLTGLNPNVMYELAVRHAVGKPVIIIAEEGTKLPFDIIDQRTIFYRDTMLGAIHLKEKLTKMIESILNSSEGIVDNPVLKIIRENSVILEVQNSPSNGDAMSLILNKILELERTVNKQNNKKYKNGYNDEKLLAYSLVFDEEYSYEQYIKIRDVLKDLLKTDQIEKIYIYKEQSSIDLFFTEIISEMTENYIIRNVEKKGYKVKGIYPIV